MTWRDFFLKMDLMNNFQQIDELFQRCETPQEKYQKIIELGQALEPFPEIEKRPEHIIKGCQSIVYLTAELKGGKMYFKAASDALISAGLAALLIRAYSGRPPEFILKNAPTFLEKYSIGSSLSPGRSNGLASMFLQMQRHSLKNLASTF